MLRFKSFNNSSVQSMTSSLGFFLPGFIWQTIFSKIAEKDLLDLRQLSGEHYFLAMNEVFSSTSAAAKKCQLGLLKQLIAYPHDNTLAKRKDSKIYQNFINMIKKQFMQTQGDYNYQIIGLIYLAYLEKFQLSNELVHDFLAKGIENFTWFIPLLSKKQQTQVLDQLLVDLRGKAEQCQAGLEVLSTLLCYLDSETQQHLMKLILDILSATIIRDVSSDLDFGFTFSRVAMKKYSAIEFRAALEILAKLIPYLKPTKAQGLIEPLKQALELLKKDLDCTEISQLAEKISDIITLYLKEENPVVSYNLHELGISIKAYSDSHRRATVNFWQNMSTTVTLPQLQEMVASIPRAQFEEQQERFKQVAKALNSKGKNVREAALNALTVFPAKLLQEQIGVIRGFTRRTAESLQAEAFIAINEHLNFETAPTVRSHSSP